MTGVESEEFLEVLGALLVAASFVSSQQTGWSHGSAEGPCEEVTQAKRVPPFAGVVVLRS